MGSEIPRDDDYLEHNDEGLRDHGGEQSDGTRPGAHPENGEDQKDGNETELHPHEDPFRHIDRYVIVGEMPVRKTGQV
jgi:hypothetical protein